MRHKLSSQLSVCARVGTTMAGPPPDYNALANGMRDAAQEFDRMANHAPLTLADLQQQQLLFQQQLQTNIQQQVQQTIQLLRQVYVLCLVCLVY